MLLFQQKFTTCLKDRKKIMEKNKETLSILRHSASHIMAQAVQKLFPQAKLAIGPSTADGFYYDFDLTDGYAFTHEDLEKIENEMKSIRELYRIGTGPSSSHTMGPRKAAEIFLGKHPEAKAFQVTLYGSLAATG